MCCCCSWRGLLTSSLASMLAPRSHRACTTARWPLAADQVRAVPPPYQRQTHRQTQWERERPGEQDNTDKDTDTRTEIHTYIHTHIHRHAMRYAMQSIVCSRSNASPRHTHCTERLAHSYIRYIRIHTYMLYADIHVVHIHTYIHRWVSTYLPWFLAASAGSIHSSPYIHRQHHAIHTSSYPCSLTHHTHTYIFKLARHISYMPRYIHTYLRISIHRTCATCHHTYIYSHTYSFTYMTTLLMSSGHVCMTVCMYKYRGKARNTQICMYAGVFCMLTYVCTVCVWYVRRDADDVCMACWRCMYGEEWMLPALAAKNLGKYILPMTYIHNIQ